MKNHHLLACVLVALSPTAGMAGETVPCPDKKAGQWYRFAKTDLYNKKTEQLHKIDRVEGDRLFINLDGQTLITDKMDNWHRIGERTATPKYYSRPECPFRLGETRVHKGVVFDGSQPRTDASMTVTVEPEFASLTVKAGSFKVVKIVSDNNWTWGPYAGRVRHVSYYAPEIGTSVKSEIEATGPERFRDVSELLEYSRGD